jgi:hypothetical protein
MASDSSRKIAFATRRRGLTAGERTLDAFSSFSSSRDETADVQEERPVRVQHPTHPSMSFEEVFNPKYAPVAWQEFFEKEEVREEMRANLKIIKKNVKNEADLVPRPCDFYAPFEQITPERVKVILLWRAPFRGRDERGTPFATGVGGGHRYPELSEPLEKLADFSIAFRNSCVIKNSSAIHFSINDFDTSFEDWARQGVLSLNARMYVVSTERGNVSDDPYSPSLPRGDPLETLWNEFFARIISHIGNKPVIGFLGGSMDFDSMGCKMALGPDLTNKMMSRSDANDRIRHMFGSINRHLAAKNATLILW